MGENTMRDAQKPSRGAQTLSMHPLARIERLEWQVANESEQGKRHYVRQLKVTRYAMATGVVAFGAWVALALALTPFMFGVAPMKVVWNIAFVAMLGALGAFGLHGSWLRMKDVSTRLREAEAIVVVGEQAKTGDEQ